MGWWWRHRQWSDRGVDRVTEVEEKRVAEAELRVIQQLQETQDTRVELDVGVDKSN